MKFRSESVIAHPRDEVFKAYRDQLGDVVPYISDISEINVLDRKEAGSVVTLHNEWVSDSDIPTVAQAFLKPEHLRWDDYATWNEDSHTVAFQIKTRVFTDAVKCTGTNTFIAEGDKTRVVLEGDFEVNLKGVPGVPRFLAGRIVPQVEKFIIAMVTPNLEKTNQAIGTFLDAK